MTKEVNNFKVYISCPMTVPMDHLKIFVQRIRAMGADVSYWERGTVYTPDDLKAADAVVVLLPDNKFKHAIGALPMGTRGEVINTHFNSIPLFIGYKTGIDHAYEIYSADITDGKITGIPEAESRNKLRSMINKANKDAKAEVAEYFEKSLPVYPEFINDKPHIIHGTPGWYDRRLLFLLR